MPKNKKKFRRIVIVLINLLLMFFFVVDSYLQYDLYVLIYFTRYNGYLFKPK